MNLSTNQRLNELSKLEENWDSYGAAAPDKAALQLARNFLDCVENNRPRIVAGVNGSVWISFADFELEVMGDGTIEVSTNIRLGTTLQPFLVDDPKGGIPVEFDDHKGLRDHAILQFSPPPDVGQRFSSVWNKGRWIIMGTACD